MSDNESALSRETRIDLKKNKQTIKIHSMANKMVVDNINEIDKKK